MMSGYSDHPFYHQHSSFYPVTPTTAATAAELDSQTTSTISHDPHADSLGPSPSLLDFSQSAGAAGAGGPYALGQFQEVFEDPDFFRVRAGGDAGGGGGGGGAGAAGAAATGTLLTTQQQQQQQHQNQQQSGYSIRENTDDLANDVVYGAWPAGVDVAAAGNVFPYEISDAYSMSSSLTSQHMYPAAAAFSTQPTQSYWDVGFQDASHGQHQHQHQQQGAVAQEQFSQSYPSLQPRALQPKPNPQVSERERLPASKSSFDNVYSSSGFDIMGALARVISRPDPRINIGAVDLSCAFVLCDITQDDDPIVYVSEAFGRLTGYTDDELIGQNCRFLQSPDGKVQSGATRKFVDPSTAFQLRSTIEDRGEVQVSIINYRKGGQPFMNLVTMVPIRWDSDEFRYYVGFQIDLVEKPDAVTKRNPNGTYMINYQRSQLPSYVPPPNVAQNHPDLASFAPGQVSAVLRSVDVSRPGYKQCLDRVLAENADDVIYVLSFDGAFLYVSPSCRKALEYEPEELLSKPLSYICHPSDIGPVFRDLRASINTAPVSVTYRIRKKTSGYVWFETHGSWHVERGRGRTFLVLVGRERPVYSLSPVASLKDNTINTLSEYDLWAKLSTSGIILYASTKSRPVLGRLPEEIVGTSFPELLNAEDRAEALQALHTARAGRQTVFRHQIRHKKGHMVDVQTRLFPGDTQEGVKPSFLVAQIRFPALSQPVLDVADSAATAAASAPTSTSTVPDNNNNKQNPDDPLSSPSSSSRSSFASAVSSDHPMTRDLLPELAPTRSSNWQTELRELERRNKALADEAQRLLTRKKKRKRKQSAMPFGKSCVLCQTRNTPEWRRGPSGNRDLCNSCGLRWAKQVRSATLSERSSGRLRPRPLRLLSLLHRPLPTAVVRPLRPRLRNNHLCLFRHLPRRRRLPRFTTRRGTGTGTATVRGTAIREISPGSIWLPVVRLIKAGACQAGPACPFLHSTDAAIDYAPCKYFTKGNCKFGAKCALAHILPDGRRVNRPSPAMAMGGGAGGGGSGGGGGHLNLGGRVNPQTYVNQDSALTNSVLSQLRRNDARYVSQLPPQEEFAAMHAHQPQAQPPPPPPPAYDTIPTIDAGLASDTGSKYGSPVDDIRFPMSPNHHHLTALDAPLPASFDSQGISHAARYGPVASSMPSKFGLELSPPVQRIAAGGFGGVGGGVGGGAPSDALRNLRDTAYGPDLRKQSLMGSSPPGPPDDAMGPRFLHSQRSVKPRMLSASVPRQAMLDDWDDSNFPMEEDYLPINLHDDVLTPQERLRRLSRTDHDNLSSSHRDISNLGMTSTSLSKMGSPLASSPSRFGALFAKQRQRKEEEGGGIGGIGTGGTGTSFPTVGSPLRESSLRESSLNLGSTNLGTSPSLGPIGSSPARQSSTSMISQQLSNMSLHPGSARHSSSGARAGVGASGVGGAGVVSSPMNTSTIDEEEQSDLVFSMEEEDKESKRNSGYDSNETEGA